MPRQTTTKILSLAVFAALLAACQIFPTLPSREIFIQRLTRRYPNNPHALFVEGKSYLAQSQPRQARARFQSALRLQPDFDEARLGLAHAYREEGKFGRACRLYGEILEKSRDNVQALEGLAVCQTHLGRHDEAEKLLLRALQIAPQSVSVLNALAELHYSQRQYGKALSYWEQSLQLDTSQTKLRDLVEDLRTYARKYGPSPK